VTINAINRFNISSMAVVTFMITAITVHAESTFEGENVSADAVKDLGKPTAKAADRIYRYVNTEGRASFTNILDNVPLDARVNQGELNSSHVVLNSEAPDNRNQGTSRRSDANG
jgi:lysozyme family protein